MPEETNNKAAVKSANDDRKLIEALVVGNAEFARLEALLRKFNIFDALGIERQEIRHSNFLAFLLNPAETHGLGELFLKRFLQRALALGGDRAQVTPLDIDVWRLDRAQVFREWQDIDILVHDASNRLVVVIENKIDSTEHSDQLQRYMEVSEREFRTSKIIGIYLTPSADKPSDERYVAVSYTVICEVVEEITANKHFSLEFEVRVALNHYAEMLRRYVVADSEISKLCKDIYEKHREALDLIYEHRPDRQQLGSRLLESWIKERPDLELDSSTKAYTWFIPKSIDARVLRCSEGWLPSRRILLFEFDTTPYDITLKLYIGPGPAELRERLYEMAVAHKPLFKPSYNKLQPKWNSIYSRKMLDAASFHKAESEFEEELRKKWDIFLQHDLPQLLAVIQSEKWIFEDERDSAASVAEMSR